LDTETTEAFALRLERVFHTLRDLDTDISDAFKKAVLIRALPEDRYGNFIRVVRANAALVATYD
jgi:hypothetical protein